MKHVYIYIYIYIYLHLFGSKLFVIVVQEPPEEPVASFFPTQPLPFPLDQLEDSLEAGGLPDLVPAGHRGPPRSPQPHPFAKPSTPHQVLFRIFGAELGTWGIFSFFQ